MMHNFAEIWPSIPYIAGGVLITFKYTLLSICFGMVLGTFLALAKMTSFPMVSWIAGAYTSIFRGTPLLVQLILVYHATPELTGYKISAFEAGILAFSLNSAAYISEIIRAGIQAVDKGQLEAALSLGISYRLAMQDIILPQAIKKILPALANEVIDLLKESSLISVLGEADILRRANIVAAEKFIYFEPLIIAGLLYYSIVMVLSGFARLLEKRMQRSD
jgi:His/Glu/Gln/Arg/opine family amino acid ABC transporter permease subunit